MADVADAGCEMADAPAPARRSRRNSKTFEFDAEAGAVASGPARRSRRNSKTFEFDGGRRRSRRPSRDSGLSIWDFASAGKSMSHARAERREKIRAERSRKAAEAAAAAGTPTWQGGNEDFESPEMKEKRAALETDADVATALDAWWDATDADGNGSIDRDEYIELGKALYRVIISDGNEEAAQQSATDDWEQDRKGAEVMDGALFRSAIFQCAPPPPPFPNAILASTGCVRPG